MFVVTIILTLLAAGVFGLSFALPVPVAERAVIRYIAAGIQTLGLLALVVACIVIVPASNAGIQVRLGEVLPETLAEGPHLTV